MPDCHITVFVPGLLGPQPALSQLSTSELPDIASLERVLSRADIHPDSIDDPYTGLFRLFGIEPDVCGDYPVAAIAQSVQQLALDGFCLRADPVHLHADMNSAVLRAHQALRLDEDEARQLLDTLNQHLAQDNLQLVMDRPDHWYLAVSESQELQTSPLPSLLYRDINPHLPRGQNAGQWRRLMNEMQMLLYDHPVNQQREQQGRMTINSLWLWGGGVQPNPVDSPPWQKVYSDDWLADSLARFQGVESEDLPESVSAMFDDCRGEVLLHIEDCQLMMQQSDLFGWLDALERFEQLWLRPLCEALQRRQLQSVTLLPANGRRYQLSRKSLRRWWQRTRPFKQWVADER